MFHFGKTTVRRHKIHVIIGNSAAGLSAIRALRRMGDSGTILLVSAEDCNAYSPVLTTYYIAGQIKRSDMFMVDDGFYKVFDVQRLFGRRAVGIDPEKRLVHLDNRSNLPYDNLLIASGASARPLKNVDTDALEFVSTLRTIRDADKIEKATEKAREIVFIGAGLVSLQIIKAILGKGKRLTLVVGSYQILSQQMDSEGAAIIQEKLEAQGISILFGRRVERIDRKGDRVHVLTNFNEVLTADLVVVGKGVKPNLNMVENTGIKMRDGILVDDQMRTTLEDVFASGDVAEGKNTITGQMEVIATWSNACAQGEIAGMNMAGCPAKRKGQFRENVTTILGTSVVSIGLSRPEEGQFKVLSHVDVKHGVYRKLFLDGSILVGALLLGKIDDAGVIRHCIANRLDVSPWQEEIATGLLDFGNILINSNDYSWPLN